MSFPKDSAWGKQAEVEQRFAEHLRQTRFAVQPERPVETTVKTASIHLGVLEDWINSLELAENDGDVEDVIASMRSYFPG